MWRRLLFILPLILSVSTIKVPVDNVDPTEVPRAPEGTQNTPIYYISDDTNVDSYLRPPNPQKSEETPDGPPTFLIPPSQEKQPNFYNVPKESADVQSDWLPILQAQTQSKRNAQFQQRLPLESIPIFFNPNQAGRGQLPLRLPPVPSTHLEPPSVDAVNEFFIEVPEDEEVHVDENNEPIEPSDYNVHPQNDANSSPLNQQLDPAEPTLALHLTPPQPQSFNSPTKQYPKKYSGGFKPVPIPLAQFDESVPEVPKAKPAKYFKPQSSAEVEQYTPIDEKKLYHFQKAEHQRKLKGEEEAAKQQQSADGTSEEAYGEPTSAEQETSETNLRYPGHNAYPPQHGPRAPLRYGPRPAPLRQAPPPSPPQDAGPAAPAPDGRTEFRMHGMKGPHSYQFGYDTGKGKNRQFRYEERDNDGLVKGHYGYMDRAGKLRVVNYSAHPEHGFRAEEPVEKQS